MSKEANDIEGGAGESLEPSRSPYKRQKGEINQDEGHSANTMMQSAQITKSDQDNKVAQAQIQRPPSPMQQQAQANNEII